MRWFVLLALAGCPSSPVDDVPPDPIACGTLSCTGGDVCLEEVYEAACTSREDTDAACPEGTTENLCGGVGYACCCEPAPPATYACVAATGCDPASCDCLTCPEGKGCTAMVSETSGQFRCEPYAVP